MRLETPAPRGAHPGRPLQAWPHRLRALHAAWPYLLAAAALLVVSEVLWLWYSWPVRQVLDPEQPAVEVSI